MTRGMAGNRQGDGRGRKQQRGSKMMNIKGIESVAGILGAQGELERRSQESWFAFAFDGEGADFRVGAVARCRDGVSEYLRSCHSEWQPMAGVEFYNDVTRERFVFRDFESFSRRMNGFHFDSRESFEDFLVPGGPDKNWFGDEIIVTE